jgi:exodeoxyribonuclease VII large subunit
LQNKINIPEYYVSEFNKLFRDVIESNFSYIRIRGEISEIKTATKGQIYLTLKDDDSIISGVIWGSKKEYLQFVPKLGIEVIVTGKITTWSRYKTTYQIDIDKLEIAGEGALLKLIEDRKKRLQTQGLFDQKYKKNIPYLPSRLGIITSPVGSVIHDIINGLKDRFPINIDIWPVAVQGLEAATSIIAALKGFNSSSYKDQPEVIIIARGGGSTEDLMTFNDEDLAKAVFKSNIPIISAIGHETDTTIIDYVSDFRAATPTAATEFVVPIKKELENIIVNFSDRLNNLIQYNISSNNDLLSNLTRLLKSPDHMLKSYKDKFQSLFENLVREIKATQEKKFLLVKNLSRIIKSPQYLVKLKSKELQKLYSNLERTIDYKRNQQRKIFNDLLRLLNSSSIYSNLKKGYVLLCKSKKIIKNSKQIKERDSIAIKFYDKTIGVNIKKIN